MNTDTIRIGHSPDPDDAFMFYGFASGQVSIPGCGIEHVLLDIQKLNELAASGAPLEVTALSVHAFLELEDRYELLEVGTSVGRGYGPRLIASERIEIDDLAGKRIALPGSKTTATLVARRLLPDFTEVHLDFREIMAAIRSGDVDAGVIIHEGQLTYAEEGFSLIADFGELFAQRHDGLPLPLGVNCVRRDLPRRLKSDIAWAYRKSVETALKQRDAAIAYCLRFGRGLSLEKTDTFVGMYVNEDSLAFNDEVRKSIEILRNEYGSHAACQ